MKERHLPQQRGAVLVQVVLALTVMFGFAALTTDYGLMVVRHRQLQQGCDAAALAAAATCADTTKDDETVQKAYDYAAANNIPVDGVTIGKDGQQRTVTVKASDNVKFLFAHAFNHEFNYGHVAVTAVATADPVYTIYKLKPLGVPIAFFDPKNGAKLDYDQPATLIVSDQATNIGPAYSGQNITYVQPLSFAANASEIAGDLRDGTFENWIKYGYDKPISLSNHFYDRWYGQSGKLDDIWTAVRQGISGADDSLLNRASDSALQNSDWQNPDPNDPRIMYLPIIDHVAASWDPINNILVQDCRILSFAAFYVESVEDPYKIHGRFIHTALPYDPNNQNELLPDAGTGGQVSPHLIG